MILSRQQKLANKLTDRKYREAWISETIKTGLPFQIQAIREQRGWSQEELGERAGMRRNAISRLENPDYGNLSVNTLIRLAVAFDCGLLIKFVTFTRLVSEFEDVSPSALEVKEFKEDFPDLFWRGIEERNATDGEFEAHGPTLVASNPVSMVPSQRTLPFHRADLRVLTSTNEVVYRPNETQLSTSKVVKKL